MHGLGAYPLGMANPAKRKVDGGSDHTTSKRVTPKSGARTKTSTASDAREPEARASTRYTPPTSAKLHAPSPIWVPILMWALIGGGLLVILVNYVVENPNPWMLLVGLGLILGGIMTATQYR